MARRGHGEGSIFKNAKGLWTASIELPEGPDGERRRKVIRRKDKQELITEMSKQKGLLADRGDLPTSSPTVAQWLAYWLPEVSAKRVRPKTQYEREGDLTMARDALTRLGEHLALPSP